MENGRAGAGGGAHPARSLLRLATARVQLVLERRIGVGVNTGMVFEGWGNPDRSMRSVSRCGTCETWFHPGVTTHFGDGRVESWTEHD